MKKKFQVSGPKEQARISILISDNIDLKPKLGIRDNEGHFILNKGNNL
jgi:hypothetical protein